jgi:hypothetical protein
MIRLDLHELMLAYAGVFIILVFIAWWLHSLFRSHREKHALKNVVRCGFCAFQFRDNSEKPLARCPSCDGKVDRNTLSRL